jgi:hypothetical protein
MLAQPVTWGTATYLERNDDAGTLTREVYKCASLF